MQLNHSNDNFIRKKKLRQKIVFQSQLKQLHLKRQTFHHNIIQYPKFRIQQNHHRSASNLIKLPTSNQSTAVTHKIAEEKGKIVQRIMRKKKQVFQQQITQSLSQFNFPFNDFIKEKTCQQFKMKNQCKKVLSRKNILKELKKLKSQKKINLPLISIYQKNLLQMTNHTNYEISSLESFCFDSIFSFNRYGPAITTYQNQLFLYGGFCVTRKPLVSCFHKYNIQTKIWKRVEQMSRSLSLIPCFHTIEVYKNNMILVGGVSINPQTGKRNHNSDVSIYNFDKKQWTKLRSTLSIRSHASTLFGNSMLIYGGIDEKQINSNQIHLISFGSVIQNSPIITIDNHKSDKYNSGLAHHKIVNTYDVDPNLKILLKYDGVFCFGGVNNDGQMHNEVTFLNCLGKQSGLDAKLHPWIAVELVKDSPKPEPRKNHSFNIINKKALILLVGGQNSFGELLDDMWVFDLLKLQWKKINPIYRPQSDIFGENRLSKSIKFQQQVSGQCATFIGSKLYVFGGRKSVQNKRENCLWTIQTEVSSSSGKKYKVQKTTNPSVNTIKESNKSLSMWNIQF